MAKQKSNSSNENSSSTTRPNTTSSLNTFNKSEKKSDTKNKKSSFVKTKKSNLVNCVVLRSFFCTEQNLSLKKGDFYHATIERIEKVNNTMYQGKKLNALDIISNE